ncbi:hypothetical protein NL676_008794 [Syzygium grande]|nr:hypothetical protein NL676_008794 [Syzygium grande]
MEHLALCTALGEERRGVQVAAPPHAQVPQDHQPGDATQPNLVNAVSLAAHPCINPHVNFNPEFDDDDDDDRLCYEYEAVRKTFLKNGGEEETRFDKEDGRMEIEEEQGIDRRAEEFIAKFYEQMKLQRQISHLQYNEMINGSAR